MRSFLGPARGDESDALSVPGKRFLTLQEVGGGSRGRGCASIGVPGEPAIGNIWTGVLQVRLKGLGATAEVRDQEGRRRAMFGMIKNSLFGSTEKTEYKLLSSETKVRDVWTVLTRLELRAPTLTFRLALPALTTSRGGLPSQNSQLSSSGTQITFWLFCLPRLTLETSACARGRECWVADPDPGRGRRSGLFAVQPSSGVGFM